MIMLDHLPDLIDPFEFAEKKRRIKGSMPLSTMDRVRDIVLNQEDEASVDLEFKREGRIAVITGRIDAGLALQCQCCLEALSWPVHGEVSLGVVRSIDEADVLPEAFEPMLVESGDAVALVDIVQDELLLALPPVPQHSECGLPKPAAVAESREHPFAVLAQLKKNPS
jgi:uncharacterized protein